MKIPGYWVASTGSGVKVSRTDFDETDLTAESRWTQAHQNDDPALPHGFTDPAQVIAEVARRVAAHAELKAAKDWQAESGDQEAIEVRTLEDLGRLCIALAPAMQPASSAIPSGTRPASQNTSGQSDDEIPFR
jgi:hypothetical protein